MNTLDTLFSVAPELVTIDNSKEKGSNTITSGCEWQSHDQGNTYTIASTAAAARDGPVKAQPWVRPRLGGAATMVKSDCNQHTTTIITSHNG